MIQPQILITILMAFINSCVVCASSVFYMEHTPREYTSECEMMGFALRIGELAEKKESKEILTLTESMNTIPENKFNASAVELYKHTIMSSIAWAKIDIENKNIHKLDANIDSGKEIMNFVGDYISRYENFKEDSEIAKASYEHIIEFYNLSIQSHFEIIDTLFLKKPLDKEEIRYHICEAIKIGEKSINVEQKNKLTENKRISAIFEKTKKDLISAYCFFSQLCQENDREDYARKYIKRAEKITEKLKDKNHKIGKKLIRCTKELDIDPNEIENKKERVWLSRNEKYQQKTDEEEKIMENLEEKNNKARGGDQGQNGYSVKNNRKKNKHIKKVKDV